MFSKIIAKFKIPFPLVFLLLPRFLLAVSTNMPWERGLTQIQYCAHWQHRTNYYCDCYRYGWDCICNR